MVSDMKIGIVGAGLSGLVIAERLKSKGYENITVFEKENRVGGKLHSIEYENKSYELGAIFGLPSQKNLKSLMKRLEIKSDGPKLFRVSYNTKGEKTKEIIRDDLGEFSREIERFPKICHKYTSLKNITLDCTEEELMLPFSDWCDIHDFKVLKNIYANYFTIFGLGDLEEIPTIYVLKILGYEDLMSFMQLPRFITWEKGSSVLTDELADRIKNIRLEQEVLDIYEEKKDLFIETQYEKLKFDRVIITSPLDKFKDLEIWDESTKKNLSKIKYQNFNVYGFIVDKVPKGCGCILDNLTRERWGHVTIWDSRWSVNVGKEGLVMLYAYEPENNTKEPAIELIKEDLRKLGIKEFKLHRVKNWKHSPYVVSKDLKDGFYKDLEDIQGKKGIYLAGEILSTLTMDNCIRYSENLVNRFF